MGELGVRYKCYKCETKFYDLNRPLPLCPTCGEDQKNRDTGEGIKIKKRRRVAKAEPEIHALPDEGVELLELEESDTFVEGHDEEHEEERDVSESDKEEQEHEYDEDEEHEEHGEG